jgi:ubiquinone/menaquinone biosynthesis C-methylase UbiE
MRNAESAAADRVAALVPDADYVRESRFGIWFLDTQTWATHVIRRALLDLVRLMGAPRAFPQILDVGCGYGKALPLLDEHFRPRRIVGVEAELEARPHALRNAARCRCAFEFVHASASRTGLSDAAFDMIFCHQSFHHIIDQERAIREFHRLLRPGGVLLFAESTRRYIHSPIIRLLFRHPMHVQKSAPEYLALIRAAGFVVTPERISYPYLWWSRADLGLLEKLGIDPPQEREETLINAVAVKPG